MRKNHDFYFKNKIIAQIVRLISKNDKNRIKSHQLDHSSSERLRHIVTFTLEEMQVQKRKLFKITTLEDALIVFF